MSTVGYWRHCQRMKAVASKGRRKDRVYCTPCPLKVVGLRIGIRTLVFAALDEEMPWRVWTSEAGT